MRELRAGVAVAALSSAFGVALLQGTAVLTAALRADSVTGSSATVAVLLQVTAIVFTAIAVYAAAVVTTNTFAVVVAGRVRAIALRRLLGATARAERRAVAREGLAVGVAGAVLGLLVGTSVVAALVLVAQAFGRLEGVPVLTVDPVAVLPVVAVTVTTWLAAVVGSRGVLAVTPVQALGGAEERSAEEVRSPVRTAVAAVLVVLGALLLGGGVLVGLVTPSGLLVSFAGGLVSFTGVVLGAHVVIPRALRLSGRLVGRSPVARLAAENAVRFPIRSTRSTVGLLVATTLITMFGVATATFGAMVEAATDADPGYYAGVETMLSVTTVGFSVLIGFSAVIAGVGLVNALSLGVLQRTRELGLLRALGFSARQLKRMILAESAQLVLTAVLVGLLLGTVYGWAGAHALLGSAPAMPPLGFVALPWPLIGVVVAGGALLSALASLSPAARATRVSPVAALGMD